MVLALYVLFLENKSLSYFALTGENKVNYLDHELLCSSFNMWPLD